jgi:[ribosomal protein S5]-alanine N-acetyltransferase
MNACVKKDPIETERLLIEPLTPQYADRLFESFCDPDLYHYIFWNVPGTIEWLRERYKCICRGRSQDGKQTWLNWVPRLRSSRDYIGFYEATIEGDRAMLAYYTFRPYQQFGFAKEGIIGVMKHIRQNYPVKKFVLEMDTRNRASVRLAESLGFLWEKTANNVCDLKGFQSHEFTYGFEIEPYAALLKERDIRKYILFRHPKPNLGDIESKANSLKRHYSDFNCEKEKIIVVKQANHILGAGHLLQFQPRVFGLANVNIQGQDMNCEVFGKLLLYAKTLCANRGADRLEYRLVETKASISQKGALSTQGFKYRHQRTEFRRKVEVLPNDSGTPFVWVQPDVLDTATIADLAKLFRLVAKGDPDFDPKDDTVELIKADMEENGLTFGPRCIHVGKIDGEEAAIVIAQVDHSSGWSRITYMGLLPKFRGNGLGQWIHRHGFTMLREQGGKLYHGGTLTQNSAMIRLFEKHGCEKYRTMQEWEFVF